MIEREGEGEGDRRWKMFKKWWVKWYKVIKEEDVETIQTNPTFKLNVN